MSANYLNEVDNALIDLYCEVLNEQGRLEIDHVNNRGYYYINLYSGFQGFEGQVLLRPRPEVIARHHNLVFREV